MRTKTNKTEIADDDRTKPTPIDYGPALDAVKDLFKWAFKLAAKDVRGWPEGRERVRNARRFLLASLRGRRLRVPVDDLVFTAGLLARIFEAELRMPLSAILRTLGELKLPTEVVPRLVAQPMHRVEFCGPIRRYPTPPPRTAEEEDAHWCAMTMPLRGDVDELAARRESRRAAVCAFHRLYPLLDQVA